MRLEGCKDAREEAPRRGTFERETGGGPVRGPTVCIMTNADAVIGPRAYQARRLHHPPFVAPALPPPAESSQLSHSLVETDLAQPWRPVGERGGGEIAMLCGAPRRPKRWTAGYVPAQHLDTAGLPDSSDRTRSHSIPTSLLCCVLSRSSSYPPSMGRESGATIRGPSSIPPPRTAVLLSCLPPWRLRIVASRR